MPSGCVTGSVSLMNNACSSLTMVPRAPSPVATKASFSAPAPKDVTLTVKTSSASRVASALGPAMEMSLYSSSPVKVTVPVGSVPPKSAASTTLRPPSPTTDQVTVWFCGVATLRVMRKW